MPPDANRPSLWRELADGKATAATLSMVTVAAAVFLTGAALAGSFLLVAFFPWMGRGYSFNQGYTYVPEEVLGWVAALAGMVFIGVTAWIWTRGQVRYRGIFHGVGATLIVAAITIVLCVAAEAQFNGDEELIILGIICVGVSVLLLSWLLIWRRSTQKRPWLNVADGRLDLRCPACGYRMIGLRDARCPECGTTYTIDELVARQDFAPRPAV